LDADDDDDDAEVRLALAASVASDQAEERARRAAAAASVADEDEDAALLWALAESSRAEAGAALCGAEEGEDGEVEGSQGGSRVRPSAAAAREDDDDDGVDGADAEALAVLLAMGFRNDAVTRAAVAGCGHDLGRALEALLRAPLATAAATVAPEDGPGKPADPVASAEAGGPSFSDWLRGALADAGVAEVAVYGEYLEAVLAQAKDDAAGSSKGGGNGSNSGGGSSGNHGGGGRVQGEAALFEQAAVLTGLLAEILPDLPVARREDLAFEATCLYFAVD
jgi:type IV secretory pathway VirJ component